MSDAPSRTVARPVANLGNTCYMNAVLQALAHAPELCLAMDCEPHCITCPVAAEAESRRQDSPSSSPDIEEKPRKTGTRKSRRGLSGRRSPTETNDDSIPFCALCEMEQHLRQVHDPSKKDEPVAPRAFVDGFIDRVAPWFKLGQQEDSHEFLRLLIDAMQRSCDQARATDEKMSPNNTQDDSSSSTADKDSNNDEAEKDREYPFSLFRGTVESNVKCDYCGTSSSTLDPIEDIGLEVLNPNAQAMQTPADRSSSRNGSPVPIPALNDMQSAFSRFASAESLDAGYKCENCGKVGRATKQSRLASIPPILTIHLKRFRYGGDSRGAAVFKDTGASMVKGIRQTRSTRSEVNQLMGHSNDFLGGKSGAAKIEGHIKFDSIFDLKPYLTESLQEKHTNMLCRLFAVVVHAGKNSHSGHYIAFVRSLANNKEWWKMDDGRVTATTETEVLSVEAYMLFYQVVRHPIGLELKKRCKNKFSAAAAQAAGASAMTEIEKENGSALVAISTNSKDTKAKLNGKNRKRPLPEFQNGEEWARKKTPLSPDVFPLLGKIQELVSDSAHLSRVSSKNLIEEVSRDDSASLGKDPPISLYEDFVGGKEAFHKKIRRLFYVLAKHLGDGGGNPFSIPSSAMDRSTKINKAVVNNDTRVAVVEPEEVDLL